MLVNSHSEETELIQKRPLKDDIFDVLHDKIVSGKYKPGQWLRQDDIATQLGVSMTPVREAFDLLVASGLAERVAYRGVRVREIATKDIVEAYGLRLYLEVMIAEEAARKITPEQVAVGLKEPEERAEAIEHILNHLAANKRFVQNKRRAYQYLPPRKTPAGTR